jgi:uncharacterized protein (DUF433 family)
MVDGNPFIDRDSIYIKLIISYLKNGMKIEEIKDE